MQYLVIHVPTIGKHIASQDLIIFSSSVAYWSYFSVLQLSHSVQVVCTTDGMQADYIFKVHFNVLLKKKNHKCLFYTDLTCIAIQIITVSYKMHYNQPKPINCSGTTCRMTLLWKQSQHHLSYHTHTHTQTF